MAVRTIFTAYDGGFIKIPVHYHETFHGHYCPCGNVRSGLIVWSGSRCKGGCPDTRCSNCVAAGKIVWESEVDQKEKPDAP